MPDHVPQVCKRCGAPLTARRQCTRCRTGRSPGSTAVRRLPLVEAIEALRPWTRGELHCW